MTDLVHGNPLWTAINAVPVQYPWLEKDETCEVAVVGAGLTGAMIAYQFAILCSIICGLKLSVAISQVSGSEIS